MKIRPRVHWFRVRPTFRESANYRTCPRPRASPCRDRCDRLGSRETPFSNLEAGIERVNAGERRVCYDVAADRRQHFRTPESAGHGAAAEIERVEGEYIMVRNGVVPRRARSVVAEVVARHLLVRGEPRGVVVQ